MKSTTLQLTIAPGPLRIATTSLPAGVMGMPYSASVVATGGTSPYVWSLSTGTLPPGLSIDRATGVISGTPTTGIANAPFTVAVQDAGSPAQSQSLALSITITTSVATLAIATTSLPSGTVGTAYTSTLAATGGIAPYSWTVAAGTLPSGLFLAASTGVISGTPLTAVSGSSITFAVQDSESPVQTKSVALTVTISPAALVISTTSLPSGTVGSTYSTTLAATGGTAPYSWTVAAGTLPSGLFLAASTGVISGTPLTAVSGSSITFAVRDSASSVQTKTVTLMLSISPATLAISTTSLPGGTVGSTYSTTLAATGGATPYTWTISAGALPAGLHLAAATGVISGTPTAAVANSSITFAVTDSQSPAITKTAALTLTVLPAALNITTTSLPNAVVTAPYSAALAATGGTTPYTWSITSGTLPAGLSLAASTGVISGTPTAPAVNVPIGFKVQDSSLPTNATASKTLTLTVSATSGSVTLNPKRAGLTVTQPLLMSATTGDSSAVNWSVSPGGGSFSASSSASGAGVTFTAPAVAGTYVVTATSVSSSTETASATIGVTDLAGVFTYHNDLNRDGANTQEYALTTTNVTTATFGKLFSCAADGAIYAQPLWVANLSMSGVQRNVVVVATEHDGLYAYDADTSPCVTLWHVSLIDTSHGGNSGEISVPSNLLGAGAGDLLPEVGVTGTPVIDPVTRILYVVSKSADSSQTAFYQRLHAIDLLTGAEKTGSPILIAATFPGTYAGGSTVNFDARQQHQRPGLALANGLVYVSWASHEDAPPYFGWVMAYSYNGTAFTQTSVLNVSPNVGYGGIWMGGAAPAIDAAGKLYLLTGNGTFDATNSSSPNNDYGDSLLQLSPSLAVQQYFTPSDQANDNVGDKDFGSGGAAILVDLPNTSPVRHLIMGGGKDGSLYVLNRDALGGFGDTNAWQQINFGHGIYATGAFWNNSFYLRGMQAPLEAYVLIPTTAKFTLGTQSSSIYGYFPGSTPAVSASGGANGLVWDIDNSQFCRSGCGPAVLHAFDAANLTTELWNSSSSGQDSAGNAVKFNVPTIANGKIYVGTRGSSTSATVGGELDVYGLKPN